MESLAPHFPSKDPITAAQRRAAELDVLDAILPFGRRDQLAELLTDEDVATLKHLAGQRMGDNTLRALASDLGYLEAWCCLATGSPLPWPAPESLLLTFVAHHLWDPVLRQGNPDHGMPEEVMLALRLKGLLRSTGPHAPATVRRRPRLVRGRLGIDRRSAGGRWYSRNVLFGLLLLSCRDES